MKIAVTFNDDTEEQRGYGGIGGVSRSIYGAGGGSRANRPPRLNTLAWERFRELFLAVRGSFDGQITQSALAAGARAIAAHVRDKLEAVVVIPKKGNRHPYYDLRRERGRSGKRLLEVIKGREGKRSSEWFPSAYLQLGGKGARHAWLVDQGHAGPKSTSPRTPGYPYIEAGIAASERDRDAAIISYYQRMFPEIARKIRDRLSAEQLKYYDSRRG